MHECEGFLDGTEGEARPKSIKIDCPGSRVDQCPGFDANRVRHFAVNVQLLDSDWISCKYDLLGVVEPDGDGTIFLNWLKASSPQVSYALSATSASDWILSLTPFASSDFLSAL